MVKNHHLHDIRGERKDQLLITTDKEGKRIGLATREECHKGVGKPHLAFLAFIIKNHKLILTKRATKKSLWPTYWDASVVSHVLSGETVEEAAHRRGKEELGAEVEFRDLGAFYYFAKHGESAENEYCHVLTGQISEEITPNPVEIAQIELISLEQLKKEMGENPHGYTPWLLIALEKYGDKI